MSDFDTPPPSVSSPPQDRGALHRALAACSASFVTDGMWVLYMAALDDLAQVASNNARQGLHDLCYAFHQIMGSFAVDSDTPEQEQLDVIPAWPSLVIEHLHDPADPDNRQALMDFLSLPCWGANVLSEVELQRLRRGLEKDGALHQRLPDEDDGYVIHIIEDTDESLEDWSVDVSAGSEDYLPRLSPDGEMPEQEAQSGPAMIASATEVVDPYAVEAIGTHEASGAFDPMLEELQTPLASPSEEASEGWAAESPYVPEEPQFHDQATHLSPSELAEPAQPDPFEAIEAGDTHETAVAFDPTLPNAPTDLASPKEANEHETLEPQFHDQAIHLSPSEPEEPVQTDPFEAIDTHETAVAFDSTLPGAPIDLASPKEADEYETVESQFHDQAIQLNPSESEEPAQTDPSATTTAVEVVDTQETPVAFEPELADPPTDLASPSETANEYAANEPPCVPEADLGEIPGESQGEVELHDSLFHPRPGKLEDASELERWAESHTSPAPEEEITVTPVDELPVDDGHEAEPSSSAPQLAHEDTDPGPAEATFEPILNLPNGMSEDDSLSVLAMELGDEYAAEPGPASPPRPETIDCTTGEIIPNHEVRPEATNAWGAMEHHGDPHFPEPVNPDMGVPHEMSVHGGHDTDATESVFGTPDEGFPALIHEDDGVVDEHPQGEWEAVGNHDESHFLEPAYPGATSRETEALDEPHEAFGMFAERSVPMAQDGEGEALDGYSQESPNWEAVATDPEEPSLADEPVSAGIPEHEHEHEPELELPSDDDGLASFEMAGSESTDVFGSFEQSSDAESDHHGPGWDEPPGDGADAFTLDGEAADSHSDLVEIPEPSPATWPEPVRELLTLLNKEFTEVAELASRTLADGTNWSPEERREQLTLAGEQLALFSEAATGIGLDGIGTSAAFLASNLAHLDTTLTPKHQAVFARWANGVDVYLRAPGDAAVSAALTVLLQHPAWPERPEPTILEEITRLLENPNVEMPENEELPRATVAKGEDVSLAFPEDVDPDVLESLLQDLPNQTAEFSQAVQDLTDEDSAHSGIDAAQRIAHTLKGAANTVGIPGVANLTHHLEDILLALAKHARPPPNALADSILRAADVLEAMGEALVGTGAPPEESMAVLQNILDWANRIDAEGISFDEPKQVTATTAGPKPVEMAVGADPVTITPMIRIPAQTIDNLLRLVGENIILTGQLHEQVQLALQQNRSIRSVFANLQQLGYRLEELVDFKDVAAPNLNLVADGFDSLEFDNYGELHTVSRHIVEAVTDAREIDRDFEQQLVQLDSLLGEQGRLSRQTHESVLESRMVEVKTIVPRLQRSVRQAARVTGKSVNLIVEGVETLMDNDVLSELVDPLMHMMRNAVDHGIEEPLRRTKTGKAQEGSIQLAFTRESNQVVIRCHDDGAGLNFDGIRDTAIRQGIVSEEQHPSREELIRFILRPNFSTRTVTTQVSGRGIGLDAVYSKVLNLGGFFNLESTPGEGCHIEIRLPLTLISAHALLVRVREHIFAVSNRGLQQIIHTDSGGVYEVGGVMSYQTENEVYPASPLEHHLHLHLPPDPGSDDQAPRTALVVQSEEGFHVLLVQEVLDSRDVVVKGLGRYMPRIRGIVGATILGDGAVSPVLDLPELLRSGVRKYDEAVAGHAAIAGSEAPRALVVDDSLSARRSLSRFMEDCGYEVRMARDGLEATEIMDGIHPDLLLVDLEMPRMNGLELAAYVRSRKELSDIPIIMVTSRSTNKHKQQALNAGVNVYVTKPFSEDVLLGHLNDLRRSA